MRSIGILLGLAGVFVIYAVVHGKAGSPPPSPSSSGSGSPDTSPGGHGPVNPASSAAWQVGPGGLGGAFSATDTTGAVTGAVGSTYQISGQSYAGLTNAQRDDVNAYAQNVGNRTATG